jgi:hypothetical protein
MTYLGDKALIIILCLMVCLLVSAPHAQPILPDSDILPQVNDMSGGQDTPRITAVIKLHWTAPGDDGNLGRAALYDLRARPVSFGPIDTEEEWNLANQLNGEPTPSMAGQVDSIVISGILPGASYYFCLKTYDDAFNSSQLSNSPLVGASSPQDVITGDVNDSGEVNGIDVVFFVNCLKGHSDIPEPISRADVNGISGVNGLDVLYLLAYLAGGPPLIPPPDDPTKAGLLDMKAYTRIGKSN